MSTAGEEEKLTVAFRQNRPVAKVARNGTSTKKSRSSGPKVKTGCNTCKIRHVKCGEEKPACTRCLEYGSECNYSDPKSGSEPSSSRRALIPMKFLQPLPRMVSQMSSGPCFESEQELRYFRIFCNETAKQIAGPFKTSESLWTLLLPQASEDEEFIYHAIVAIGALTTVSREKRKSHHLHDQSTSQERDAKFAQEYKYALSHYEKALAGMIKAKNAGKQDEKNGLLACLLSFCMETLLGRQGPACALAIKGLELFKNRVGDYSENGPSHENALAFAFASLDIHVLFFLDTRPLALHMRVMDEINYVLMTMPLEFENLIEAGRYWQRITRRDMHFKAKARIIGDAASLGGATSLPTGWTESAEFASGQVPFPNLKTPSPEIKEECETYISNIYRWSQASSKVINAIPENDVSSRLIATLLQILTNMNLIILAGVTFDSEISYDSMLTEFGHITTLAASIYPNLIAFSEDSALFHFDLGVLPALYLVGTRCRDRKIRGQAINLLFSSPYREGMWDSLIIAHIANWIRSVEEEGGGFDDEYIPESRRAFLTSADIDLFHRRAKLYCTQKGGPSDEDLIFREAFIQW